MMKRVFSAMLAGLMMLSLAACGGENQTTEDNDSVVGENEEIRTLSFGHAQSDTHLFNTTVEKFRDSLEEKSNGTMTVEIFANGTLGDEREMAESLQMGTLDMCISAVATLSAFDSDLDVFNFPYLFENTDHAYNVLMGDLGFELFQNLEENSGIKYLGQVDLGFRSMTNNDRPINAPADCQGLRMRTLQSSICVEALGTLGIDAVSMSFGELFTALQTGAVDGQENPISVIYSSRFYEVQKYLSLTEHLYPVSPILISMQTWDSLNEEQQNWVSEAMNEALDWEWKESPAEIDDMLKELAENGMEINEVDKTPFIDATQIVYENHKDQYGDLVERIRAEA